MDMYLKSLCHLLSMAESHTNGVEVVDESKVAPPPGSVSTTTIPLTFFDMVFFSSGPTQRIFFYEFPYPTLHFTQNIYPNLKNSLSFTLNHFFPFAANLTCPPPPDHPYILYNEGDSVLFTVAESDADFNHLISNQARDNKAFQSLVPKLPKTSDKTQVLPIMAIQVTVFPNSGISIGFAFNHVAADGRSFNHFVKSWAFIHRSSGGDQDLMTLPNHNKDLINDPNGLSSIYLNDWLNFMKNLGSTQSTHHVTQDNIRLTLVLSRAQIEKLKQLVITQSREDPIRISTYVVICAFMWVILMKLKECEGSDDQLDEDMLYHFAAGADCRERFELQIPAAYFGNCLAKFSASAKRSELMGNNGILVAARAIGRAILKLEKGPLIGAEKWVSDVIEIIKVPGCLVTVAGSPKFRVYETDFGWGKPKKSEVGHIGSLGSFSLNECRDEEGGIEIGLVFGRHKLDFFNALIDRQAWFQTS